MILMGPGLGKKAINIKDVIRVVHAVLVWTVL